MDQTITTSVTETHLETAQHTLEAEELTNSECPICSEPFSNNPTASCIKCRHMFHETCLQEWILNDTSLQVLHGGPHGTYWDYNLSRCPICRTHQKDTMMVSVMMQNFERADEILLKTVNQFIDHVNESLHQKGEDLAIKLYENGNSFHDIPSTDHFTHLVDEILTSKFPELFSFVNAKLKCVLRKNVIIYSLNLNKNACWEYLNKESYKKKLIRGISFSAKAKLFEMLYHFRIARIMHNAFQQIHYKVKTFVLENIVDEVVPPENIVLFNDVARDVYSHCCIDHANYYSDLRTACSASLNAEEMEKLTRYHFYLNDSLLRSDIRNLVSKIYVLDKIKIEMRGTETWKTYASNVVINFSQRLSDLPPDDLLVITATEPPPKRMRTRSQGPPET